MIFPPDEHFTVKHCRSEGGLVTVCADGREEKTIDLGDEVHIAKANKNLNLIFLKENSNLEVFFRKF